MSHNLTERDGFFTVRECPRCKTEKAPDEFPLDPARKSGRHSYCKECRAEDARERALKRRESGQEFLDNLGRSARKFGLTAEFIQKMLDEQEGRCAICGGGPTGTHRRLVLDHDHDSGEFRGLICGHCNNGLGMFRDNPDVLRAAADYLEGRD